MEHTLWVEKYRPKSFEDIKGQKEIIEKQLPKPLDNSRLLSGTTILGSGNVCPVLDVASIMDVLFQSTTKKAES